MLQTLKKVKINFIFLQKVTSIHPETEQLEQEILLLLLFDCWTATG